MEEMRSIASSLQRYFKVDTRPKDLSCDIMLKKKNALFWAAVNMICIFIIPFLIPLTPFQDNSVKMIANFFFLSNVCMQLYVVFRDPKEMRKEMAEGKASSRRLEQKDTVWVKLNRPANVQEDSTSSKEPSAPQSEGYSSPSPPPDDASMSLPYDQVEPELISEYFQLEVGVLITPKGVVIKHCRCPVQNQKCRLCPFRAYPLAYYKSWFWGTSELPNEDCPYCGVCFQADECEYMQLLKTNYPLHQCICKCSYCRYAMSRPLQPRVNLVSDMEHCSCICHQCRSIEDVIHGLKPLDDERQFRFYKIPFSNSPSECYSLFPPESRNRLMTPMPPFIETGSCRNLQIKNELWRRFGINPFNLVTWVANLRTWISNTILKRIVEEIGIIDHRLQWCGLPLISVGQVGFDILRATAGSEHIARNIPSLALVLPFLEICANQEYVVQRIRELALGNNMREFAGQSSGRCSDPMWSRYVPSDSELVMHLVLTYFDSMIRPLHNDPGKRPFSSLYFSKAPNMPPQTGLAIYQQSKMPPCYKIIVKEKIYEVPSGHNNVFFTLLIFVHCIKVFHQSTLGKTNLGPAGLNMLWIVEDAT